MIFLTVHLEFVEGFESLSILQVVGEFLQSSESLTKSFTDIFAVIRKLRSDLFIRNAKRRNARSSFIDWNAHYMYPLILR